MERYQRWVAQRCDWVQPSATEPLPTESASAPASGVRRPIAAPKTAGGESLEVISSEQVDLDALARHIERRNPQSAAVLLRV